MTREQIIEQLTDHDLDIVLSMNDRELREFLIPILRADFESMGDEELNQCYKNIREEEAA